MVKASARRIFSYTEPGRGIPLWVGIDDQDAKVIGGQGGSHVNSSSGFSDSALLIRYRENLSQAVMLSRFRNAYSRFT